MSGTVGRSTELVLDHVVWRVDDLAAATRRATDHGFTVVEGGTHEGGYTRNALIPLADDSYLELLAFNVPPGGIRLEPADNPLAHRFVSRSAGRGFIDAALRVRGRFDTVIRETPERIRGPFDGRRVRPDGTLVQWRMGFPAWSGLPFVIQDVTDRAVRIPPAPAAHPNGATGIAQVVWSSADPVRARTWLATVNADRRMAVGEPGRVTVHTDDGGAVDLRDWLNA